MFKEWEDRGMKLHDALRKTVREYGVRVIAEKRLIFILADLRAFEEYPAVKPVLESAVSGGAGKELVRLFLEEDRDWFLSYAGNLKKSLSGKSRFRDDLADYAVGSILFGLGGQDSVTEPSDHGFDPVVHGSSIGNPGAGGRKDLREKEDKAGAEGNAGGGSKEWGAGVTMREHSGEKIPEPYGSRQEASGSVSAAPLHAVAKDYSKAVKWVIAAALIAGGFALGIIVAGSSHDEEQTAVSQRAEDSVTSHDSVAAGSSDGHDEEQSAAPLTSGSETSQDSGPELGQYEYEQGEKYYNGHGADRNYAKAREWFRKAADKGHSGAEYRLGWMYEHGEGEGLVRDYHAALGWYRSAAGHGSKEAQSGIERVANLVSDRPEYNLVSDLPDYNPCGDKIDAGQQPGQCEYEHGEKYYYGYGVNADDRTALDWYLKAAKKGNAGAEYKLGWMYEQGKGVTPIYEMALRWYRKAAAHGNKDAQAGIVRVEKLISAGSYDRRY